ncbi:MAG: hypothetical protein MMC33_005299 [Icmadophila ericetorum]|nr:hypothetical protein [Icmadophila ericetorum]
MSENGDTGYNNANRAFLQAFMGRSTLTYEEAKPILAAIFTAHEHRETLPEDITEAHFVQYINAANNAISPYDLEIRSMFHQTTRQRSYALVNSTSDPMTQLATTYSADEIGFLKRILDAMFETNNTLRREIMAINSMQAMQLCKPPASERRETQNGTANHSAGQGLKLVEAEKTLKSLVDEGWFEKSSKGYHSLSPRAIMELRGWLIETYNELGDDEDEDSVRNPKIKLCEACKEIVTVGQRCSKLTCPCRLHSICIENFFKVQKSKKCPICKTDWTGKDHVGELAASKSSKRPNSRSSGTNHRPQARSGQASGVDGAAGREEEGDEEEVAEEKEADDAD